MSELTKTKARKKTLGSYPYLTVVFSITISLFVIGLFALLFLHGRKLSSVIRENIEMHVYLDNHLPASSLTSIKKVLAAQPYVYKKNNTAQIKYISKEEAAKKFIEETGEDFSMVLSENPLRASYVVKIDALYFEADKMKDIAGQIKKINGVFEVDYPLNLVSEINRNIRTIGLVMIGFSILLLITTVLLINNTIKLALFSQRFLIRSMQLVGATSGFIQKPFLIHATLQGFLSGVLAVLMLTSLLQYAYSEVSELAQLKDIESIAIILGSLLILGVIIGLLSSYRAVKKYLKMSLDELY